MTFDTIKNCVTNWFGNFGKKIVAVSSFNNEVVEISLFRDGQFTTSAIFGNVESYDSSRTNIDINEINQFFNLQCIEEIQLNELNQIEEIYEYFTNLFNLPIGLSSKEFKGKKAKQFSKISFVI